MLVASIAIANAQFFVQGNMGLSYDDNVYVTGNAPCTQLSINVSPQAGYWLNDNIAVGARVSFSNTVVKNSIIDMDDPSYTKDTRNPSWKFSVFARYKLWEWKKFSLLIDGSISTGTVSVKEKTESIWKTTNTWSTMGIDIAPAFSYELTEKFSIITRCNFLSLGFYSQTIKIEGTDIKTRHNRFDFNTQSTIFSDLGNINIGFIYNF